MNVATISCIAEESLRSSLTESGIFDRIIDLVPRVAVSGAFPHGKADALREFDVDDEDIVTVVGEVTPLVTVSMLRAMRGFFGTGDEVCVTVRRMIQPHPVNASELFRWLRSVLCDGNVLRSGIAIADRAIVRRLDEGKESVLRIYRYSPDYDLLGESRHVVRMIHDECVCRPTGNGPDSATLEISRPETLVLRMECPSEGRYCADFLARDGEMDYEAPFVVPSLWRFNNKTSLKTNSLTGQLIQGRQQYPEVFAVEPLVAMGRLKDLVEYPALLRAGKVRGFPFDDRWEGMGLRMWRCFAAAGREGAAWIS